MMFNSNSIFSNALLFVGRIFVAQIFILAGVNKILEFQQTVTLMGSMGVPLSELLLIIAIVFELGGGLLLFFGYYTQLGSVLLILFVVLVTYYFHSFWEYDAAAKVNNLYHFTKNLSIVGGLCYVYVCGAGRYSLDHMFRKK